MGYSGEWWVRVLQEAEVLGPELGTAPTQSFCKGARALLLLKPLK